MKRIAFLALMLSLVCVIPLFAAAHSGRTDSNGGHWDSETGEYHYHHGYPAHQHYDMDGDGVDDCPYDFKDNTKSKNSTSSRASFYTSDVYPSSSSSKASSSSSSSKKSSSSASYSENSNYYAYKALNKNTEEPKSTSSWQGIVFFALFVTNFILFIALLVSRQKNIRQELAQKGHEAFLNTLLDKARKDTAAAQERSNSRSAEISRLSLQLSEEKAKTEELSAELEKLRTAAAPEDGESYEEKNMRLTAQIKEQEQQIKRLTDEAEVKALLDQIPKDVYFDKKGRPISGTVRQGHPFGDFTAYLNPRSGIFHIDPLCAPYTAQAVHIFDAPAQGRACTKCARYSPYAQQPPEWYETYLKVKDKAQELGIELPHKE